MSCAADLSAFAVAISGRTRAGKTTLANALSRSQGWPRASFSDYVRSEAARRGVPEARRDLQELGAQLVETQGGAGFAAAALQHAGLGRGDLPLVVEGARHVSTLRGLRTTLGPHPVFHLHLDVSNEERDRRLAAEGVSPAEGARWERHSTEREVLTVLPRTAGLVIDADLSPDEVLDCAIFWLREQH